MKLEREVIIDLLPAYFSGEASAATRMLVEEFFRENPDFEKSARSAAGPLESLRAPAPKLDPEKEKLALERARMVTETRSSFFWIAVLNTLILFLFRIQNGKVIWISGTARREPAPFLRPWPSFSGFSFSTRDAGQRLCRHILNSCGCPPFTVFCYSCSGSKTIGWYGYSSAATTRPASFLVFSPPRCGASHFIHRWKAKRAGL